MEGNCRQETPHRPTPTDMGCNHELTRSNSDASSLTADNCKDIFRRSANVTADDSTVWTDEKHNSYLYHLEMSFVKQLHQSKCFVAQCSEQNQRDINISQKQLINLNNASEQIGRWQKGNYNRGEPRSYSTSADSHAPLRSKRMYNLKHMCTHWPPPSAEMLEFTKLCSTVKQGKQITSHGLATCLQEFSSNNASHGDLLDLTREGMGQNFMDEENKGTLNSESQAKRWKATLPGSSSQDQIVPSKKCCTADYPVTNSSVLGEELARYESVYPPT